MKTRALLELRPLLLLAALLGLVFINGPFLYFTLIDRETYDAAMRNGMALAFIAEALLLTALFAFLIARMGMKPGWLFFVGMSLAGSLAFSVPLQLYLMTRHGRAADE